MISKPRYLISEFHSARCQSVCNFKFPAWWSTTTMTIGAYKYTNEGLTQHFWEVVSRGYVESPDEAVCTPRKLNHSSKRVKKRRTRRPSSSKQVSAATNSKQAWMGDPHKYIQSQTEGEKSSLTDSK